MSTGLAALISWTATAALGAVLLALWMGGALARRRAAGHVLHSRPPPYIPHWLVVGHVLSAVVGLVAWVAYLRVARPAGGVSLGALVVVALLGASMFVRWLGSRRLRRVARAAIGAPAESRLPTIAVIGHGVLGVVTVVLVVLSYLGPTLDGR
jgi:hypothetical protein